jgi:hypothetical protein
MVGGSDSLVIVAKRVVQVRECDQCGKEPAYTWTITGPEGAIREIELCERHGAAVANAYALGRAVPARPVRRGPARRRATPSADLSPAPPTPEPIWR